MTLSLDIASLERLYAGGEATPEGIVREVYARIGARGVRPDWITLVEEDAAVAKARAAQRGPLHGIPFAVKDNIDVAGLPTTCACPEFAYVAERSATVVERLEQAGAILIGKTNLDQFATGLNGTRSPYGIPASTFNPGYISGGSSSGSAVAVAAGLVSFALGTDTAGSGRVPAAFNNIVGLKPSKGLISMRGVVPACQTQDAVSIFALTVADAARVAMTAIAFDGEDAFARSSAPPFTVEAAPAPLRVGVPIGPIPFFGDKDYEALYHASIDRLAALGAVIVLIDFTPFARAASMLYAGPWVAERLIAVDLGAYTNFVNLMDLAALAVPAGFRPDGIPFGVTLIGRALSDGVLAAIGDALHRSLTGARLGATAIPLSSTPPVAVPAKPAKPVKVAVVGAHLGGQPLNWQLVERKAKLLEATRTGPGYRLYALADTSPAKPGLVFDGTGPGGIEVEVWEMEEGAFGSFVALIPAPLGIGTVTLADGRTVKGFLCETYATIGGEDITAFGGWRAWLGR